jgi:hypothetical protein
MGSLELYDRQGGDLPEVTNVERGDGVIQMQRRPADQQVFERNLDALGFLLAFDASVPVRFLPPMIQSLGF